MSDLKYWVWLSLSVNPGSRAGDILLPAFDYDAEKIYNASEDDYSKIDSIDKSLVERLCDKDMSDADEIIDYCHLNNIGILTYDSAYYPSRLRRIERAPILLYYRGKLIDIDDNVGIATVGTRRFTDYGRREAYKICRDLAIGGAIVISGMARGIDSICHRAALDVNAHTIAVLGCGINKVYPPENEDLMNEIIEKGTVFSEFRPFTDPIGTNFPIRNRIISGLSLGTLVVEADLKSGAMITARYALKQGRDIFAVPGKIGDANSLGTNELIQKGAKMVQSGVDILGEYEFFYPHRISIDKLPRFSKFKLNPLSRSKAEKNKVKPDVTESVPAKTKENEKTDYVAESDYTGYNLSEEATEILLSMPLGSALTGDELSRGKFSTSVILSNMTRLEIKGLVRKLPGGKFIRLK